MSERTAEPLLITGARVNRVDEEGEVTLFCYSLDRTFSFHVSQNEIKSWALRIGKKVCVQVLDVDGNQS